MTDVYLMSVVHPFDRSVDDYLFDRRRSFHPLVVRLTVVYLMIVVWPFVR